MSSASVKGVEQSGLAKKPYSAGLGIISLLSTVICAFSGGLLAFDFLGYHAHGHASHPEISSLVLIVGLSLAILGQLLGAGRNEGIRVRGWLGIIDVLLIRLAFFGIVFMGWVFKYAIRGKPIPLYPVGMWTIACGFVVACRLLAKYVFHIDHRRRLRA